MTQVYRSSPSGPDIAQLLCGPNLVANRLSRLSPASDPNRFFDWDYFCSGGSTSGAIGRLGWNLGGSGTPAYTRVSSNLSSPAKANLSTSNVSTNTSFLTLGDTAGKAVGNPGETALLQCAWRMNNSLATKRIFFGWCNNFSINPNTSNVNAFGLAYDSSVSPNYLLLNKNGTALSQSFNTGIVVPQNSAQLLSIVRVNPLTDLTVNIYDFILATETAGVVTEQYIARDVQLALSGAIYTANLGFYIATTAAVVSTLELGYFGIVTTTFLSTGLFSTTSALLRQ